MNRREQHERGATAIEYALIGALVFLIIVPAVALVGGAVENLYNEVAGAL